MANSYVDFRGRFVRVNDQLLTIIVLVMRDVVVSDPALRDRFGGHVDAWCEESLGAPPGLIAFDLSAFEADDGAAGGLATLLAATVAAIRAYGSHVPGQMLNDRTRLERIRFIDTDVNVIVGELEKWRKMTGED